MHNENIQFALQILLLLIYFILFIIQIILLYQYIRKKKKKYWLYTAILAMICCLGAIGIMFFYDSLPGYGMMPGLTYLSEWVYSFLASIIFAGMFLLALLSNFIISLIKRIKNQ